MIDDCTEECVEAWLPVEGGFAKLLRSWLTTTAEECIPVEGGWTKLFTNVCTTFDVLESGGSPKLVAEDSTDASIVGTDGTTEICIEVLIDVSTDERIDDVASSDGNPEI